MRTISRGKPEMNIFMKWMTLLLSVVTLGLAGCGGDTFSGGSGGGETPVAKYISVAASPSLVGTNESTEITATLYDQYGETISDVLVTFTTNSVNDGTFPVPISTTGSNGEATNTYTAGTLGGLQETITVSGGGLTDTIDIGVVTVIADISTLEISLNPPLPVITAGTGSAAGTADDINVEIAVKDTDNNGVDGQYISLIIEGDGTFGTSKFITLQTVNGAATTVFTTPTSLDIGSAKITAQTVTSTGTLSADTSVNFIPDTVTQIQTWASPASIGLQDTTTISARLRDQYNNLVSGENVTFSIGATHISVDPNFSDSTGATAPSLTVATDSLGVATASYNSDATIAGTDEVDISVLSGAVTDTVSIEITTVNTSIGDITVASQKATITADGADSTGIIAIVTDTAGDPMEGETVTFTSTAGTLAPVSGVATTDATGKAVVYLQSGNSLATASIKATVGNLSSYTSVDFIAGPIAQGVITAVPSSLLADGTSTSTVTVSLQDANGNPVADGTTATLYQDLTGITDATIASNTVTTSGGRAEFTITAATSSGADTLYLVQLPALTYPMSYGVGTAPGDPASIEVSSDVTQISVQGVGQQETATVSVTVKDGTGTPIDDEVYDNIRVTLQTSPNAGEYLSGTSDITNPTSVSGTTIDIFTSTGQTSFGVQSGTRPGIVEVLIEVLDATGATLISAAVPQLVIASGPAFTINFTFPNTDAVINDGAGIYQRRGSVLASDRYGNSVTDGTTISLGMIDTVLAEDTDGDTSTNVNALTSASSDLSTANVTRNGITRFITADDRVLLFDAIAADKSRFTTGPATDSDTVPVHSPYTGGETVLSYVIGSSHLGATIFGVDDSGNLTGGYVKTKDGAGEIRIQYEATKETIHSGCYGTLDASDTRTAPADSSDVLLIASANNANATTIEQRACLSSIVPWVLTNNRSADMNVGGSVGLKLVDGGDSIALPFLDLSPTYTVSAPGLTLSATNPCTTDINGECEATITITGGASGDTGTVTYASEDYPAANTTINIAIP